MDQSQPFLSNNLHQGTFSGQNNMNQIQVTPTTWEQQRHFTEGQLNFRTLSVSMDRLDLEMNPPVDR